eukprot:TRINITY_DN2488_c0_g1_i1.p1 TRINITY_DN2488_c0_g1~~TRINITY_DN2488_c0_g1_i1.p1  ORF type:complete len:526 (-),score=216.31 TRINITY_DN2488_c0_g1_i1:301-1878(-)
MAVAMKAVVLLACLVSSVGAQFPAEGLYVTLRNDALMKLANQISLEIANEANADTTFPAQHGSNWEFDTFAFHVDLQNPTFTETSAPTFVIEWTKLYFVFTWNYHVSESIISGSGVAAVFTMNADTKLSATMSMSLTGPTVSLSCSAVNLIFNQGDIEVWADGDFSSQVVNGIAQNFVPMFEAGLLKAINTVAAKYVNTIPTSRPFPNLGMSLVWTGGFDFYPATAPNMILYASGTFEGNNKAGPPFSPSVVPPASVFTNPSSQLDLVVTEYMVRSAVWALANNGKFNLVITSADVPANSPVKLNTNSVAFLAAAPGLIAYPNMNITVTISLPLANVSDVSISADGVFVDTTVSAVFSLVNATTHLPGWSTLAEASFTADVTAAMSGNSLVLTPKVGGWGDSVVVTSSSVGNVSGADLTNILKLVLLFAPQPKPESFAGPADFTLTNAAYTPGAGYFDIGLDIAYAKNVPATPCGPSGLMCPQLTTCCQINSVWDCYVSVAPCSQCCAGGYCCNSGYSCCSTGCC